MATQKTTAVASASRWIWPFELIEQIGEGGMGIVYRARYVVNNREVALKMLPGDVTDKVALARFERELEVLKNLKHPNIVRCFGGVSEDKQRFYAMELVEGGSLEDELQRRGRLSIEQVISYGLQMCAALECSHNNKVIHRDVKPSNFLIANDKQLKLSDFGLASVSASRRITAAGKTAGTLLYMSPEQIRGGELTPQTDLYALGCVFYELLTGKPPYVGESPAQTMHMHCRSEIPRVSQTILDCPASLDKLIAKLMAKEPGQRPQSAAEVAKELRTVSNTITVKIDPKRLLIEGNAPAPQQPPVMRTDLGDVVPGPQRRSRADILAFVLLGLSLAASLVVNFTRDPNADLVKLLETKWIDALQDPHHEVRVRAVTALGELDGQSARGLQAVSQVLENYDPGVRRAAVVAMSRAGTSGKPYIPTLMRLSKDDQDREIRDLAGIAVSKLRQAPDSSNATSWIVLASLTVAVAYATYRWMRRAASEDPIPVRRPVLTH